jgi:hypothetical protein
LISTGVVSGGISSLTVERVNVEYRKYAVNGRFGAFGSFSFFTRFLRTLPSGFMAMPAVRRLGLAGSVM